jgi:predicted nucleotidyltransferase
VLTLGGTLSPGATASQTLAPRCSQGIGNPLLYNVVVKIEELLRTKREKIMEICQKHGVSDLRVFGSLARGEGTEQSDVDFLVEVGPVHSPWFPAGFVADLEDLLGVPVDVVTRDSLHWFIKDRVLEEARPL